MMKILLAMAMVALTLEPGYNTIGASLDAASAALKIKKGFKVCDTNKDGCLSLGEIKKCVEKFGDKHPDLDIPKPKLEAFLKAAGEDRCMTLKELIDWIKEIKG